MLLFCGSGDSRPDRRNGKKGAVRGCKCLCMSLSALSFTPSFAWQVVAVRDPAGQLPFEVAKKAFGLAGI